jgi:hypothetical protein
MVTLAHSFGSIRADALIRADIAGGRPTRLDCLVEAVLARYGLADEGATTSVVESLIATTLPRQAGPAVCNPAVRNALALQSAC